jgi:hypothetical protein
MFYLLFISVHAASFTEMKIGSNFQDYNIKKGCQIFHLGTNYQRTKLQFTSFSDSLTHIRWSNILTSSCDTAKCPKSATVCGELQKFTSTETVIGTCINDLYLYVKATADTSFSATVQYVEGTCDKIIENLYTQCGAMNYAECDRCDDECRVVNCIQNAKYEVPEKILMNLCLPYNVSDEELNQRCKKYINVNKGTWKSDCSDPIDTGSVGVITIIALVFIMIGFFGFIALVSWYNWKLKTTGSVPIKCFKFCPDILFPKPALPKPRSLYTPPDMSLQRFK